MIENHLRNVNIFECRIPTRESWFQMSDTLYLYQCRIHETYLYILYYVQLTCSLLTLLCAGTEALSVGFLVVSSAGRLA